MSVLFVASEVGSVRALAPICYCCHARGIAFHVVQHGFFAMIQEPVITASFVPAPKTQIEVEHLIGALKLSTVLFSVNVKDPQPLFIARIAAAQGLTTIHVLDFWNGYQSRMMLDGKEKFTPDIYAVPDQYAAQAARAEDIPDSAIKILGQPAFADAIKAYALNKDNLNFLKKNNVSTTKAIILLILEPVLQDQGDATSPNYRGYVEADVMHIFVQALRQAQYDYHIIVLPHPRQEVHALKKMWTALGGDAFGHIMEDVRGRELLPFAIAVVGMASTLLYEAWLVGRPVLSIQPNLIRHALRVMFARDGVAYVDQHPGAVEKVTAWLNALDLHAKFAYQSDVALHQAAPDKICDLLTEGVVSHIRQ